MDYSTLIEINRSVATLVECDLDRRVVGAERIAAGLDVSPRLLDDLVGVCGVVRRCRQHGGALEVRVLRLSSTVLSDSAWSM